MAWTTDYELTGRRVLIYTGHGDSEEATIIAVSDSSDKIKVETDDGETLVGNQWEEV